MFWYFLYYASAIIILPGILFSIYASFRVKSTFKKYNKITTIRGEKASSVAYKLLLNNGCPTSVTSVDGHLTDHYNPKTKVLALSNTTYYSNSVASVAVAAHEAGHAVQDNDGYFLLKLRSSLVPFVNIGSYLAFPLALIGVFLEYASLTSVETIGQILIAIGIILYSLSTIFALVTLPVEINASSRALKMLIDGGFITETEKKQMRYVLYTAALTYVASLVVSLLYLFRFLILLASLRKRD